MPPENKRKLKPCAICPNRVASGLFSFPSDEELRKKWKAVCNLESIKQSDRVCLEHFDSADFMPMSDHNERQRLNPGVIPSKKLPSDLLDVKKKSVNTDHSYATPDGKVARFSPPQAKQSDLEKQKLKKQLSNAYDQIDFLQKQLNLAEKQRNSLSAKKRTVKEVLGDHLSPAQFDIIVNVSILGKYL